MIIDNIIKIKISNNQISYYRNLGYETNGNNEILSVKISDLPPNSGQKINVKCDICENQKIISLNRYKINTKDLTVPYACSRKCAEIKNKKTILDKYNVNNISKLIEIKKKKENTCISNHGVKYPQQLDKIRNKSKITKKKRYDDENYNNIDKLICIFKNKMVKKYNAIDYIGEFLYFKCNKGHIYKINNGLRLNRIRINTELCTICNPINSSNISGYENMLHDFIKNNYIKNIIFNDRHLGKELDIYIPDLKLAFEFNGIYWHNELYKDKNYHLNKTELCEKNGIQLIHIYEDDWIYKQDIVKSMILNKLGKTPTKIYARKCEIREITDNKLVREFLDKNHIQGFIGSKVKLGLFYENELVSLMTFGKRRVAMGKKTSEEGEFELLRFCSKLNTNVVGGGNKLFKHFVKNYDPKMITTYADRSWSQGNLYKQLGFKYEGKIDPNYYYIIDGVRQYDTKLTEHQIMLNKKIYRIFDSGNLKFKINI
jgi:hypothetical protein